MGQAERSSGLRALSPDHVASLTQAARVQIPRAISTDGHLLCASPHAILPSATLFCSSNMPGLFPPGPLLLFLCPLGMLFVLILSGLLLGFFYVSVEKPPPQGGFP